MATGPTRTDHRRRDEHGSADRRTARLAELVAELSSCDPDAALDAVRGGADGADPLELVARAMTAVRHRALEPQDRFRVAGFLRPAASPLPRRVPAATSVPDPPDADDDHLVHHGSLRRWERTGAPAGDRRQAGAALALAHDPDPQVDDDDDVVIDLRDRT